jgi:[methyl-Co(III) methanol/glycine betaine-specific corrinoid protein]:coenzyme M methyltransferase
MAPIHERVMATLRGRSTSDEGLPCVSFSGTYTEELMRQSGAYWPEAHKDPEKMARLGSAAHEVAGLNNVSVPFDMLVEAEALGAQVDFHDGQLVWPSIRRHTVSDPSDFDPPGDVLSAGRISVVVKAIASLAQRFGGEVPVNVFMAPPFTSVSNYLIDPELFYRWLRTDPDRAKAALDEVLPLYTEVARLYEEAGADTITLHEMGGSTDSVSPSAFRSFVKPYIRKIVDSVRVPVVLNMCGRIDLIVPDMVETGAAAIAFDERTPVPLMRSSVDRMKPGYPLIGNLSPVNVIHRGPAQLVEASVRDAVRDGISMVAPGCDFWIKTPTEHVRAMVRAAANASGPA